MKLNYVRPCFGPLLIAMSMSCISCGPVRSVDIWSDPSPYVMLEHGLPKRLYITHVHVEFVGAVAYPVYLTNKKVKSIFLTEALFLAHLPVYRRLDQDKDFDLLTMSEAVCPPFDPDSSPKYVNWIISDDPLIVAIGAKIIPDKEVFTYGGVGPNPVTGAQSLTLTLRLLTSSDMTERVTELYVLPHWPAHGPTSQDNPVAELANTIKDQVIHIKFDSGLTVEEVIKSQPWLNHNGIGKETK